MTESSGAAPLTRGRQEIARDLRFRIGTVISISERRHAPDDEEHLSMLRTLREWEAMAIQLGWPEDEPSALEAAQHRIAELEKQLASLQKSAVSWMDGEPGWPCGCGHDVDTHGVPVTFYDRCERHNAAEATLSAAARLIAQWREKADQANSAGACAEAWGYEEAADDLARVLGEPK